MTTQALKPFSTLALMLLLNAVVATSQTYFPPKGSDVWEAVTLEEIGWCDEGLDTLLQYVERNDSKAFIVLKDGRIAIEWYASDFSQRDNWYWASAAKTVTATLVGILQEQGSLDISRSSSTYLGQGWTSLSSEQEAAITVWHQLTMTSGLDDRTGDPYCTDPECLVYKEDAGSRWAYHNAPYTLLDGVIEGASGETLNRQFADLLATKTGMDGAFFKQGYNNVLVSTPRSMARFGLLALNNFDWDGETVLADQQFIRDMITPSQDLNRSYGYLWWLNGQESFMLPGSQIVFPGPITSQAPPDAYYGLGKNDQIVCVVPSENVVVVRMGEAATPDGPNVPTVFVNELWSLLREVICTTTSVETDEVQNSTHEHTLEVYDLHGRLLRTVSSRQGPYWDALPHGVYLTRDVQTGTVRRRLHR